MNRIGIYLRISDDQDGTSTATARQRADCERYAAARGWDVVDVFEDMDLSAYRRKVKRPEFERMLTCVVSQAVDGVLAWKIDRLTRRQRDLVRLDEACEDAHGFIATVVENIDTRQPTGRFVAELLVAQARMESENSGIRIRRKHAELAEAGIAHRGGTRPFGYSMGRDAVIAEEASVIRETATRVFAGESLRGLCYDLNARGVLTSGGLAWRPRTLKRTIINAGLSAQREHDGVLTPGNWTPILTPDDTKRLRLILDDPLRHRASQSRRYLLTGMLRCGLCGESLIARPTAKHVRRYICAKIPFSPSCGKLGRGAEGVERLVKESVLIALDGVDLRDYVDEPTQDNADVLAAIKDAEMKLEGLATDYADDVITRAEWFTARDRITGRLEANRARLAKGNGRGLLNGLAGAGDVVRAQWDAKGLDWQRSVIGALVNHVVVMPAPVSGRRAFDPELVRIVWRF